jgi:hypothetical protein
VERQKEIVQDHRHLIDLGLQSGRMKTGTPPVLMVVPWIILKSSATWDDIVSNLATQ